jgi:deoxyadenosine/deoxycytidine kinase
MNDGLTMIWGFSCTGKTTLAEKLSKENNAILFKTDSYIDKGFKESIYFLMEDLKQWRSRKIIIEGVQVPRLLRAGLLPNIIIHCVTDDNTRLIRYKDRGKSVEDFDKRYYFDKAQETIWNEYIKNSTVKVMEYRT